MALYLLDKAYRVAKPYSIAANRVVVAAPETGECKLPSGPNDGRILGITATAQPESGRRISVRKAGTIDVLAAGPIPYGAPVIVADIQGRIKAINPLDSGVFECVGFAETTAQGTNDMVEVFVSIHQRVHGGFNE